MITIDVTVSPVDYPQLEWTYTIPITILGDLPPTIDSAHSTIKACLNNPYSLNLCIPALELGYSLMTGASIFCGFFNRASGNIEFDVPIVEDCDFHATYGYKDNWWENEIVYLSFGQMLAPGDPCDATQVVYALSVIEDC